MKDKSLIEQFKSYLSKEGYTEASIKTYSDQTTKFIRWCKRQHTTPQRIDYKTCMKYLKYLQRKKLNKRTTSLQVISIKNYLNYLVSIDKRESNPIAETTIKGAKRIIHYNILEPEELEDFYYSFYTGNYQEIYHEYTAKRDKMMIGFMIYQGLSSIDLKILEVPHLQIQKGKLYVPSRGRSNARELELKPWQIMECVEYIQDIRPKLLQRTPIITDAELLFPRVGRFVYVENIIKKLKVYNQKLVNAKQIRASVITHWLSQYNLRKVQYLAGHRYISSTERYLQDDLESLHEMVNQFHPIH